MSWNVKFIFSLLSKTIQKSRNQILSESTDRKFDRPVSKTDSLDWSELTFNLVRLGSVNLGNDIHWSDLKHSERTVTTPVISLFVFCLERMIFQPQQQHNHRSLFTLVLLLWRIRTTASRWTQARVVLDSRRSCGADLKPACHNLKSWDLWAAVRRLMTSYGRNTELKLIHFISSVIGLTLIEPNYRT